MTYTVWRSNGMDEIDHGTYDTLIDAFKEAYALWWTYTTKSERKKQEVYITENREDDPEALYVVVDFYGKNTIEELFKIVELYREAYDGLFPSNEMKMLCYEPDIDDREETKEEVKSMIAKMNETGEYIPEYVESIVRYAGLGDAFDEDSRRNNGEHFEILYWMACEILGVEA